MSIRLIASVVIAALLMTGGAVMAAEVTEYGVQQNPQPAAEKQEAQAAVPEVLTAAEAQAVTLAHAGLTEAEVTGLRAEYDVERGTPEWDIDFRSGDYEYDYEVNAETGEVLKHEKEYDPVKTTAAVQEAPVETVPPETQPEARKLTADEAKAIALAHAGLTADQVKGLRAEYDVERGIPEWEVEFRSGDYEYDYKVNAETGEVLRHEKEYDPAKTTAAVQEAPVETVPPETQPEARKLTADEAKAIALAHAGLTADQVKGLRAEYDVDDGVPEWEVEFRSGNMEYDYEIHGETGKILSWDKERDD